MRRVDPKHYTKEYYLFDCNGYHEFKRSNGTELELRLEIAVKKIPIKRGMKILDIGCGRGEIVFWAAKKGAEAIGIDYSKDAIELANKALSKQPKEIKEKVKFQVMDGKELSFKSKSVDGVVMIEVWEHLYPEEQEEILKEIFKILKDDGFLFIHTAPSKWFNDFTYRFYCYPISSLLVGVWNIFKKNKYPNILPWKQIRTDSHKIMHVGEPDYFSMKKIIKENGFYGKIRSTNITVLKPEVSFKDKLFNFLIYLYPLSKFYPVNAFFGNDFIGIFRKK